MRLQETQNGNDHLKRQVIEQRKCFRNKTNQMQYEIDEIKNALAATKVAFGCCKILTFYSNFIFMNLDRILQYKR